MTQYAMVITSREGEYTAHIPDLKGCMVTGPTIDEVRRNLRVALCFHLGGLRKEGKKAAEPRSQSGTIEVCVPQQGKEQILRYGVLFVVTDNGYSAYVPDLIGVMGQAQTVSELTIQMRDKILAHLEDLVRRGGSIDTPQARCESIAVQPGDRSPEHSLAETTLESSQALHQSQLWWTPTASQEDAARRHPPLAHRVAINASWGQEVHYDFVLVPRGRFEMGSPPDELGRDPKEILHRVTLTRSFLCKATPVTHSEWTALMGTRPWHFKRASADAPVEQVSWFDAVDFCNRLSQICGLHSVYKIKDVKRLENGLIAAATVLTNFKRNGYRLPTEAEWEYACRGETTGPSYASPHQILSEHNSPSLDKIAWYSGNSGVDYDGGFDSTSWKKKQYAHLRAGPHPVAEKEPNAFGLYDMLGNVWEWCWDRYDSYRAGNEVDPSGGSRGAARVFRGGAWSTKAVHCRAASRCKVNAGERAPILGFRPVRNAPLA